MNEMKYGFERKNELLNRTLVLVTNFLFTFNIKSGIIMSW